jgi:energy-coupling factor transporter ATP-binding protein EcfA2
MRIERIHIEAYGPIEKLDFTPAPFQVVFGSNEAGKTAIVEILNYILFKRTVKDLRYEKPCTMLVEIEDAGETHELPSKKKSLELPAGDVANLLYVQASESSIYGARGEASFWDGMKSMLSRVGKGISFTRLDEQVFEAVALQPKRETWKREKQEQIDRDDKRKTGLEVYLKKIGEIEKQESELVELMEKNKVLKKNLDDVENYKNYRTYRDLTDLHNKFKETRTELQAYERYKRDYLVEWQKLEAQRKAHLSGQAHIEKTKRQVDTLGKEMSELKAKQSMIDEYDLKSYQSKPLESAGKVPLILSLGLLLTAVAIFIVSFFTQIPMAFAFPVLIVGVCVFLYFVYRQRSTKKWSVDTGVWLHKAQEVFPDITSLEELQSMIGTMEDEIIKKETLLQTKTEDLSRLSKERTLTDTNKMISQLREKTGLAELADLEEKMTKKARVEETLTRLNANISERLHETDDRKWDRLIAGMKIARPDKEPDLEAEKDMRAEKDALQERINSLKQDIQMFRDVEQTKFEVTNDRAAFTEYDRLDRRLRDYELEKEAALAVRRILRSMSSELDEFIEDILSGEDSLGDYFKFVTKRYNQVTVENRDFVVTDLTGKSYDVEELSSGARDQLLLCFRIAALRKVYPDGAFLILDDAFIFADWQRRQRLAQLAKKFVEQGNQVIYLTSDDHTRDLLAEFGANITTLT